MAKPAEPVTGLDAAGAKRPSTSSLENILIAARSEFAARGFDGARLETVAREAGVTKQLVYHYFKTKEELYGVVLDRVAEQILLFIEDARYEQVSAPEAIAIFVGKIIDAFADRPFLAAMTLDEGLHQGEHVSRRSQYVPTIRAFVSARIAPLLERGATAGDFRPSVDPMLFYWSAFSLATAVFLNRWVMSQTSGTDFASPAGIAIWRETATGLVLAGLRPED